MLNAIIVAIYGKLIAIVQNGEKMKKTVKFMILLFLLIACFSIRAAADSKEGEYVIAKSSDGYLLYSVEGVVTHSSISECLGAITEPSLISFSSIAADEPLLLPKGEYTISGNLDSGGIITVPTGASVAMRDMTLTLGEDGYVRIKGGSLTVEASSVMGEGRLIRLDYSSSSSLEVISGSIFGETDAPLIDIENGRALILGADIENKGGAAIRSDSELCLSGSPVIKGASYGIILEAPMYMGAYTNEYYSQAPLTVQYMDSFYEGTLTEIFYEATERSLSNVTLYDKDGKAATVTHFHSSPHTIEENFGGVYLPHTVKFFVKDKQVAEVKLLSGERIAFPVTEGLVGYEFDNWYRDREGNDAYSPEKRVYSSFSLYGIYQLNAPTFSISSLDLTYDGEDHTLAFDSLSHPVDGGYYTYVWYKDGSEISTLSQITVRDVSDSGIYSCRITYNLGGDSASVYAENIKVNIKKQRINAPTVPPVRYTGLPLYPSLPISDLYTADIISGIDAGVYPLALTLTDPENYAWAECDGETISVAFEITKAENGWVSSPTARDSYIGLPLSISATPLFGEVEFLYSATENGTYTYDAPTSIGSYYVKAKVRESKNYTPLESPPVLFRILPEEVIGLELLTPPSRSEYLAFEKFDMQGMEIAAVYNSGRRETISSARLTCTYNDGKSLRVGDSSVAIGYLGASLQIPISVLPLSYDLSSLGFESESVTYDGGYHTLTPRQGAITGLDGIPLAYEIIGGGKDAGEYTVTLVFSGESRDYTIPDKITATLTVLPREVDLVWGDTEFIYDSSPKLPTAYFIDAMGVKREVTVCGSAMLAGDNYTATATVYSKNYTYKNPTCPFLIAKADYDMSEIYWSDSSLVYNGILQEVTLENLPEGISVVGYTDNRAANAGKYTATASLKYDERNYNAPTSPSCEWEISPAEYDMSGFGFTDAEYEYDGEEHFPLIEGILPTGADGIRPAYTLSRGAINTADGSVTVTMTFSTESKNYIIPSPLTAEVKIIPKGIYVVWAADSFVYDGGIKSPTADSPLAEIKVSGGNINAGSYTATAASLDPNYRIINSTFPYEIAKAANRWLDEPRIEDFYESGTPDPIATPYYGRVEFNYYTDYTATEKASPTKPGEYYMVATVPESENYLSLSYTPIPFTCIEVVPTGMRVEVTGELVAFTPADNAIKGYLIYNDGSESEIPANCVSIKYQNGDSPRRADTQMEISYSGFTEMISISVAPASYDLSSVYWDETKIEYDGIPHVPTLKGLPEGIGIVGYVGEAGTNAGEYTFSVILSYDEENYIPPEIADCTLTIAKATIAAPSDLTVEYSGSSVTLPTSPLLTVTSNSTVKDSGEYNITYSLSDSNNYVFENGESTYEGRIIVSPRKLTVTVSDLTLYWLESEISPLYTVEGEIAEGDLLNIYFYVEGEKIYAASDNKNYSLTVVPGTLERLPYPSEEMKGKLITALLLIVILLLVMILIFKKRDDLYDIISMLRARKKHREGTGFINNAPVTIITDITYKEIPLSQDSPPHNPRSEITNTEIQAIPHPGSAIGNTEIQAVSQPESETNNTEIQTISYPKSKINNTEIQAIPHPESETNNTETQATLYYESVIKNIEGPDVPVEEEESPKEDNEFYDTDIEALDFIDDESPKATEDIPSSEDTADNEANGNILSSEDAADNTSNEENGYISEEMADSVLSDTEDIIPEGTADSIVSNSETTEFTDITSSYDTESIEAEKLSETPHQQDPEAEEPKVEIKMEYANSAITNALAKRLIKDEREVIYTSGRVKSIINVDTLSRSFVADDRVDVNILKNKSLVPYDTNYIKVLARGAIDKPLHVYANEFSLAAVKMILLSGGEAIRVISEKSEKNKTKD